MHTPTQLNVFKDGDIVWKHGIEIHAKILPHFNATIKYYSHSLKYFERGGVLFYLFFLCRSARSTVELKSDDKAA